MALDSRPAFFLELLNVTEEVMQSYEEGQELELLMIWKGKNDLAFEPGNLNFERLEISLGRVNL